MMMYKTWYDNRIEPVEVLRTTENSVYLPADPRFYKNGERRQQKHNPDYESFWPTWKEAHEYLVTRTRKQIDNHETTLRTLKSELEKILAMREEMT